MKPAQKTAFALTLNLVFSALAAIALAEAILVSRAPTPPTIPFYNELHPYVMFRPHGSATFRAEAHLMSHHRTPVEHYTNEDGIRIENPHYSLPKQKPTGQRRVVVLGGSAVQLGSRFEDTLPGALRAVLRCRYPGEDIEVINAGIQSCVSRQSIAHLLFTVVDYQPDIVLLYDGVNDLGLPLTYESRSNYPYNFQTMVDAWEAYRMAQQAPLWKLLLNRSRLYAGLRARLGIAVAQTTADASALGLRRAPHAMTPEAVLSSPEYVRGHVAEYLSNWSRLIELSESFGYETICVLQPTGGFDRPYSIHVLKEQFGMNPPQAHKWLDALAAMYQEAGLQIKALPDRHPGTVILNMSGSLTPARDHFWDTVHVYDEVNETIAADIADAAELVFDRRFLYGGGVTNRQPV